MIRNLEYGLRTIDVVHLGPGSNFGEQILFDNKIVSTIKCLKRCHFAVLTKIDFDNALNEIDKRKINDRVNFLK